MKTDVESFQNGNDDVPGAGLSRETAKEQRSFVRENDGKTEAFDANPSVYDAFVEVEGPQETREGMVKIVGEDDGRGGTGDSRNREHGGVVQNDGSVVASPSGPVTSPLTANEATIELNTDDNTKTTFHSHPSGTINEHSQSNSMTSGNVIGGVSTTYGFSQLPSLSDVKNARKGDVGTVRYVFGRGNDKVYIYNGNGVQAVISTKAFLKLEQAKPQ